MEKDTMFAFKATATNSGATTRMTKVLELKRNGKPLQAGDVKAGQTISFHIESGEVTEIEDQEGG